MKTAGEAVPGALSEAGKTMQTPTQAVCCRALTQASADVWSVAYESAVFSTDTNVDNACVRNSGSIDASAFMGTNPRNAAQLIVNECIGLEATVELAISQLRG